MTTIASALAAARRRFQAAGIKSAALDARLLLCKAAELDMTALIAGGRNTLAAEAIAAFAALCDRRATHEPVARILGTKEFRGLSLAINEATLVPRPETEILVDAAFNRAKTMVGRSLRICDLGTGSGAILIALLSELDQATGVGADISQPALDMALANARRHGIADRIRFIRGNFSLPLDETFDLVVANPPYIPHGDLAGLDREVRDHDPALALDGGPDGLAAFRVIAAQLPALLGPGGAAFVEIGAGQGDSVAALFAGQRLKITAILPDLAGIGRIVVAEKSLDQQ
ncbi:MAG TPA: peptide chain release factor N(5)-glutamine methyltransferase [Afifellaceae bacterium]|nr:peptide chain release factor N(5)-glutamine methyltransferase [Afifellaceae bacterium]